MHVLTAILFGILVGTGCSKMEDVQATVDGGGAVDVATEDGPSWEVLRGWLHEQVTSNAINGFAVQIFDGDDNLVFATEAGTCEEQGTCPQGAPAYTVDLVTGVASSSKWVTSTTVIATLERAVSAGRFASLERALDAPLAGLLTCPAPLPSSMAAITIRQLLSFTDGLLPDHPCVGRIGATLVGCACSILVDSAAVRVDSPTAGAARTSAHPPGTTYKYGESHHVVAGAVVEQLARMPWPMVYETLVATPAGMAAEYRSETLLSGSLRASVSDYAKFVRALFHDGRDGDRTILSTAGVEQQERSQMPAGVAYLMTPQPGLEYGLNTWRWCYAQHGPEILDDPTAIITDASCTGVHQTGHGGKGGFQPWIDRERGFYGVFAMREPSPAGGADYTVAEVSITTAVRLYAGLVIEQAR
jgi:D-alanyl-D-alanine-carboxypeptidase/D-alanyl-D-alanine-endopeptidase